MLTQTAEGRILFDRLRCCQCGVCLASCKWDAFVYSQGKDGLLDIGINTEKCTECGLCVIVCPSHQLPKDRVTEEHVRSAAQLCLAHAKDEDVRWMASSGGVARTLIQALLASKHVDAVYSLVYPEADPPPCSDPPPPARPAAGSRPFVQPTGLEAEPRWLRQPPAMTRVPCSLYRPVVWGRNLDKRDRTWKRVLLVGLPCQLKGASLRRLARLDEKIVGLPCQLKGASLLLRYYLPKTQLLRLAIMCRKQKTLGHTECVKRMAAQPAAPTAAVFYRGLGWPGKSGVYRDGRLTALGYFFNATCWTVPACHLCPDCLAPKAADVTLADPWRIEAPEANHLGGNLVFVWTEQGRELLKAAADSLEIRDCPVDAAIRSASFPAIRAKESALPYYLGQEPSMRKRFQMRLREYAARLGEMELAFLDPRSPLVRLQVRVKGWGRRLVSWLMALARGKRGVRPPSAADHVPGES